METSSLRVIGGNSLSEIEKKNIVIEELRSLVEKASCHGVESLLGENSELRSNIASLEGQLLATKECHEKEIYTLKESHKRSKEIMQGQNKNANGDVDILRRRIDNITNEKSQLLKQLKDKDNQLEVQQVKLESREKEIKILEGIVEKITGVKCDTEEILERVSNINIDISGESLVLDYDKLVDKLNSDGGLMVLTREEATELVGIVKANRNYLVKSTTGKGLVFDEDDTRSKIEMVIDYINNGEKSNKSLADKYGITTAALINRINTLKKSWYEVVKLYVAEGYKITNGINQVYGEKYNEILGMLEKR